MGNPSNPISRILTPRVLADMGGPEAQIKYLMDVVHVLWKEVEKLEQIVQVIPEGLTIKTGASEITVLKNGGIVIKGLRIHVSTPGKDAMYY